MARLLITGARGQLGRALAERLQARAVACAHAELDIADASAVNRRIAAERPAVVFNTAAFNRVDDAEEHPDEALLVNGTGPLVLAQACRAHDALLVHFSSDYVFSGDARVPLGEEDPPSPRSAYGASKLAGERAVAAEGPRHMILRTCGLYGSRGAGGKGGNFVDTIRRLAAERGTIRVVDDQRVSPTSAADLAVKAIEIVDRWLVTRAADLLGLYHVTNAGSCSWYEFAREIVRLSGLDAAVEPITTTQYGARAPRPAYSVLARRHLGRLGLDDLRSWREALAEYLNPRIET
ncbi:MAG: dTDP-4-dehydrorhamnose reductase [Candidatus Binatia bacterium]